MAVRTDLFASICPIGAGTQFKFELRDRRRRRLALATCIFEVHTCSPLYYFSEAIWMVGAGLLSIVVPGHSILIMQADFFFLFWPTYFDDQCAVYLLAATRIGLFPLHVTLLTIELVGNNCCYRNDLPQFLWR